MIIVGASGTMGKHLIGAFGKEHEINKGKPLRWRRAS